MDYNVSSKVEQRGIIAGMLIGDGVKHENNFFVQHSIQQKDYVLFKKQLLEQITEKPVALWQSASQKGNDQIRIEPRLIPLIRVMSNRLYPGGHKTISRKFLNFLTPQGIAIWFMDDGSKSFKKQNGVVHAIEITLNTYTSFAESEAIVSYFSEEWGFKWGLNKSRNQYRLRMGTQEGKRFLAFLSPYIHPSMRHKIQTSQNRKVTT